MMRKFQSIDKIFLGITALLALVGLFVFTSASFGLFARKGFSLKDLLFDQVIMGLFLGIIIATFVALKFNLKFLQTNALYIFIGSVIVTLLVFVPSIGLEHCGAHRWIDLRVITFQPSEFLKLGTVIYFAALLPILRARIRTLKTALIVTSGILFFPAIVLLAEPDTGTFAVLFVAVIAMLLSAGMRLRHFALIVLLSILAVGVLALARPYVG